MDTRARILAFTKKGLLIHSNNFRVILQLGETERSQFDVIGQEANLNSKLQ